MGIDFIGLLLAALTAIAASLAIVLVITVTWATLGFLSLPLAALTALFILVLGAMLHATITSSKQK
jgi:hypothetical protein